MGLDEAAPTKNYFISFSRFLSPLDPPSLPWWWAPLATPPLTSRPTPPTYKQPVFRGGGDFISFLFPTYLFTFIVSPHGGYSSGTRLTGRGLPIPWAKKKFLKLIPPRKTTPKHKTLNQTAYYVRNLPHWSLWERNRTTLGSMMFCLLYSLTEISK